MKLQLNLSEKEKNTVEIIVNGDLIIKNSREFKYAIYECLSKYEQINISLKDITSIDISTLQLIYSLQFLNKEQASKINVSPPENPKVYSLLQRTGLLFPFNTLTA